MFWNREPTTVAEGMIDLAKQVKRCAKAIAPHEPLSIEILRKHGMRLQTAQLEYFQAMGALMRDLGRSFSDHPHDQLTD
jgi:hypothetical protein